MVVFVGVVFVQVFYVTFATSVVVVFVGAVFTEVAAVVLVVTVFSPVVQVVV